MYCVFYTYRSFELYRFPVTLYEGKLPSSSDALTHMDDTKVQAVKKYQKKKYLSACEPLK